MVIAYPANAWLVAKGLKHGMGTVRALGKGGHSVEADAQVEGSRLARTTSLSTGSSARTPAPAISNAGDMSKMKGM